MKSDLATINRRLDRTQQVASAAGLLTVAMQSLSVTAKACTEDIEESAFQNRLDIARLLLNQALDSLAPKEKAQ